MDLLLFSLALIGVALLAVAFGHDSRDEVISKEHAMAQFGLTWSGAPQPQRLPQPPSPARPTPAAARLSPAVRESGLGRATARVRVAAVLYRLADWLSPGVGDARTA